MMDHREILLLPSYDGSIITLTNMEQKNAPDKGQYKLPCFCFTCRGAYVPYWNRSQHQDRPRWAGAPPTSDDIWSDDESVSSDAGQMEANDVESGERAGAAPMQDDAAPPPPPDGEDKAPDAKAPNPVELVILWALELLKTKQEAHLSQAVISRILSGHLKTIAKALPADVRNRLPKNYK